MEAQTLVTKGGKRRGKAFEREWYGGMQAYSNGHGSVRVQRYYDLSDYVGKYCPVCKQRLDVCGRCNSRLPSSKAQPPRQPADFETVYKGISILQETKSSHSPVSFDTGNFIKPHQWSSLLRNIQAQGEGVFVIQNRSNSRDIKVYCVDAFELDLLRRKVGKFSVRWADIASISFSSPPRIRVGDGKDKKTIYDYAVFLADLDKKWEGRRGLSVEIGTPQEREIYGGSVDKWGSISPQLVVPKEKEQFVTKVKVIFEEN